MNIAFPALLILLFALPGILFRYTYNRGTWETPFRIASTQFEILAGLFFSLVIHLILSLSIEMLDYFSWIPSINYRNIVLYISGFISIEAADFDSIINSIAGYPYHIMLYLICSILVGYFGGLFCHFYVRRKGLDRRFDYFKFNNPFYYLLNGEILFFDEEAKAELQELIGKKEIKYDYRFKADEVKKILELIDLTIVSGLIHSNEESILYIGVLRDFFFDKNGKLDSIILAEAHRRYLNQDEEEKAPSKYYKIPGTYLQLKYSNISNINVHYVFDLEESEDR